MIPHRSEFHLLIKALLTASATMAPCDHSIQQIFFHFKKLLGLPEDQRNQKLGSIVNNPDFEPIILALARQATPTRTSMFREAYKESKKSAEQRREAQRKVAKENKEAKHRRNEELEKAQEDKCKADAELSRKRATPFPAETGSPIKKIQTTISGDDEEGASERRFISPVVEDSDGNDQNSMFQLEKVEPNTAPVSPVDNSFLAHHRSSLDQVERYTVELVTTRGTPPQAVENYCIVTLGNIHRLHRTPKFSATSEYHAVVEYACPKFDPEVVQRNLDIFLSESPRDTEMITVWNLQGFESIYSGLLLIKGKTYDRLINRAYGQIKCYLSVEADAEKDPNHKGSHLRAHLNVLESLARKKALLSHKEDTDLFTLECNKVYENYRREYQAGQKWLEFGDMFGGDGIVILFIVAGTSQCLEIYGAC